MFWSTTREYLLPSFRFGSMIVLIMGPNDSGLVKGVAKAPEIAEEDINTMFTTNVTGLINVTQAIMPIFLGRPNGGQGDIINIGSIAGTFYFSPCPTTLSIPQRTS